MRNETMREAVADQLRRVRGRIKSCRREAEKLSVRRECLEDFEITLDLILDSDDDEPRTVRRLSDGRVGTVQRSDLVVSWHDTFESSVVKRSDVEATSSEVRDGDETTSLYNGDQLVTRRPKGGDDVPNP